MPPLVINIFVVGLTGICSLLILLFGFQNSKIWEHESAISGIKVSIEGLANDQRRTEETIVSINSTLTGILGSMQSMKDANEAQTTATGVIKDQLSDMKKQLDGIDSILRPLVRQH